VKKRKSEFIKAGTLSPILKPPLVPTSELLKVKPSNFRVERTGKITDTYESLEHIGKGAYGEIRKVRNKYTNAIRAIKIISKCKCQMTKNFADEIYILQQLVTYK
jgi:serine/threonine protein kinase